MNRTTGRWVECSGAGGRYRAFVPSPLPPDPPLDLTPDLLALMERANRAVGRLDGIAEVLPATELFLFQYVRKEALLSAQIEGTQSSFSDLLLFELEEVPGVPFEDVREVSDYVAAMDYGLERISGGFPLSVRLIREIHERLLSSGRGRNQAPGQLRRSQVWLGGTRPSEALFVPPPWQEVENSLAALERFIHNTPETTPILIKAALAHVQFETIHPFLDGNGRLGRLLITLLLCADGVLGKPILYLSLHFKAHRQEYYDRLQAVRTQGDFEGWLRFFLEGTYSTSRQAVETARRLLDLFRSDRETIERAGKVLGSALRLHELFQSRPLLNLTRAADELKMSHSGVSNAMDQLAELSIVREVTGRQRNRIFVYAAYLDILREGVDPLPT